MSCVTGCVLQTAAPDLRLRTHRLRKLAAPKVTPVVLAVTFVGWLTSLSVVALVPIDVYSALGHKDPGSLDILWSISYWCAAGRRRRRLFWPPSIVPTFSDAVGSLCPPAACSRRRVVRPSASLL